MFSAHSASIRCVDFASDGVAMLSASDDKTVKVIKFLYVKLMLTGLFL